MHLRICGGIASVHLYTWVRCKAFRCVVLWELRCNERMSFRVHRCRGLTVYLGPSAVISRLGSDDTQKTRHHRSSPVRFLSASGTCLFTQKSRLTNESEDPLPRVRLSEPKTASWHLLPSSLSLCSLPTSDTTDHSLAVRLVQCCSGQL